MSWSNLFRFARRPGNRGSWATARRFRPLLESMEERITPAVNVAVVQGVLTIKAVGADFDDDIVISPDASFAGRLEVQGQNGTAVNGTAGGDFIGNGIKSIKINLGEGDDRAELVNVVLSGNVTFLGGAGANTFTANQFQIGGSLTVTNGTNTSGQDQTNITGSIGKNLTVHHGVGDSQDQFTVNVGGNLSVTALSAAVSAGNNLVQVNSLILGGGMAFKLAQGNNSVISGGVLVGQGVTYAGGAGDDLLSLTNVTLGGSIQANLGAGSANALSLANAEVGGKLTLSTTSNGQLNLNQAHVGGNLVYHGGSGTDQLSLTNTSSVGALGANLGGGTNVVSLDTAAVRALAVSSLGGLDSLQLNGNVLVHGKVTASLGNGNNQVLIANSGDVTIGGALTLTTGNGADLISIGQAGQVTMRGAVRIAAGPASVASSLTDADQIEIENGTFAAALTISSGAGNDLFSLDSVSPIGARPMAVAGLLTVSAGSGDDQLFVGDSGDPIDQFVSAIIKPVFKGGAGGDTITLLTNGVLVGPPPPASVNVLPSAAELTANGWETLA